MTRLISTAASIAASVLLVGAATDARAQGAYYVAKPAAETTKSRVVTRSTPWRLAANGAYVANRAPERDLVLCQLLARNVGPLQSFSAGGAALDADALGKCNGRAKQVSGPAMAAASR